MNRARRAAAALAALTAFACGDIAEPLRNDLYEWRLIVPSGVTADTIHFHWARSALPVRVWAEEIENLPALTQRAIDTWESVFLYREFQAELVADSLTADVIVLGSPAPAKATAGLRRLPSALAPECSGATDLDVSPDLTQLRLPIRIYISPVEDDGIVPNLQRCLMLTTVHEMGHALGIFAHSPNPTDMMYVDPQVDTLSRFDRETAEALYHLPPTIEAVR